MQIRKVTEKDAPQIVDIYNYYIQNTDITFETSLLSSTEMQKRIAEKIVKYEWLVGEAGGKIIGYAYYGLFRERAAYMNTVESTIYLDHLQTGKGYGTELYRQLIESAAKKSFREMIGVIALPNPESTKLHAKLGFIEAGILKNVGYKFDRYIDTGFWQKSLE